MQFHVTIDTTRAASISLTHGLPARTNKLDTEFELPNHWTRKECIDALAGYIRNIEVLPYLNLTEFEESLEPTREAFRLVADTIEKFDGVNQLSYFFSQNINTLGGSVSISIREVSYL